MIVMQSLARESIEDDGAVKAAYAVELLLEESIRQYEDMHEQLLGMKLHLDGGSVDRVASLLDEFNRLGAAAREHDRLVEEQLNRAPLTEALQQKLKQRQALQADIVKLIEKTVSKAGTVKSYLANEFQSLKKGRAAIRGYRSGTSRHGRIVNRSS